MTPGPGTGSARPVVTGLGALAITGLVVGTWALLAPGHFFHEFPLGQGWVATDGPYNEHLVRDVGGLNLALGLATALALAAPSRHAQSALAWGWAINGVTHFAYHVNHLGPFDTLTAVIVALITASTPVLAGVALASLHGAGDRRGERVSPPTARPRR